MPLLRSFGFWWFAIYKDAAPMGLSKAPSRSEARWRGSASASRSIELRLVLRTQPRAGPVRFGCDWAAKFLTVRDLITRWGRRDYDDVSASSLQCGPVGPTGPTDGHYAER